MKIPDGRLKKITGFMVESEIDHQVFFVLNEIDYAHLESDKVWPKTVKGNKARELYNELYKRFPK